MYWVAVPASGVPYVPRTVARTVAPQVLQGLKECAVALADPFGGDAVDFDVDLFLANILSNARALIAKDAAFQPGTHMPCPPLGKESAQ